MSDARSAYQRGHNVDAAINVHGFTGDAPRIWSREINTSEAEVHDVDKSSTGARPPTSLSSRSKSFRPEAARVFKGPGEHALESAGGHSAAIAKTNASSSIFVFG